MNSLRVSLLQFDIAWEDPVANRQKLDKLIDPLAGYADIVLLPEMFSTGFSMNAAKLAEPMDGDTVRWMSAKARRTGAAIAGSIIVSTQSACYNRFLFVTPDGLVQTYDKRHLFSIGTENQYFLPGDMRVTITYKGWRIALYICYDLRFPVWCRCMEEADLALFTANWPEARMNVWETLLAARAIENQVYVAGVNRTGRDGSGVLYKGGSRVLDPKGHILQEMNETEEGAATISISLSDLQRFRDKFPVWKDRDRFRFLD